MEAYGVATMRNLPDAHPINKLLVPHFRYTMGINRLARLSLINKGGIMDQVFGIGGKGKDELFLKAYEAFHVDLTNIEKSVKRRGVKDIPGYYYRDDGLAIFQALKAYVTVVVNKFYPKKKDVKSDLELQEWAEDIHTNAFPGSGHGFPNKISTNEELIERCTVIMFTGSAQHAAVNFGQYGIYGFVPNAPFTMQRPVPTKKGKMNRQDFLDALPDKNAAKGSINITYALSQYGEDEVSTLG